MTEFKSYPSVTFHMPEDGKVTGQAQLILRGNGSVLVRTDAHINDDKPALNYRGESFLFDVDYTRQADGSFAVTEWDDDGRKWSRIHVTRRQNWSDAPPSFAKALVAAVAERLESVWTPELDRAGLEADVAQRLHSLEREEAKLAQKLEEVQAAIEAQSARLTD